MEKIQSRIKKGITITDTILTVVIGIFLFSGMLTWVSINAEEADIEVDERYNETVSALIEQQAKINTTTEGIRDAMKEVEEADGLIATAFFGLRGMLTLFLLPLEFIAPVMASARAFFLVLDFVPQTLLATTMIVLTILITFSILRFFTQRGNEA